MNLSIDISALSASASDILTGEVGGVTSYLHGELAVGMGLELRKYLEVNGEEIGGDELGISLSSYMLTFGGVSEKLSWKLEEQYKRSNWR